MFAAKTRSLKAFGLTDVGCVRANNEDSHFVSTVMGLYVVADGMGGAAGGAVASKIAVDAVVEYLGRTEERAPGSLVGAFQDAHSRVRRAASEDERLNGMGTTLVALLEGINEVYIASVGDSRAYLFEKGQLRQLTVDQTWVNEVGRRIGVPEENLTTHPMRHVLTVAVGATDSLRVHTSTLALQPGAQILLCCDGLHGTVPERTIAEILSTPASLETRCSALITAARGAGGPDNITVVLAERQPE